MASGCLAEIIVAAQLELVVPPQVYGEIFDPALVRARYRSARTRATTWPSTSNGEARVAFHQSSMRRPGARGTIVASAETLGTAVPARKFVMRCVSSSRLVSRAGSW